MPRNINKRFFKTLLWVTTSNLICKFPQRGLYQRLCNSSHLRELSCEEDTSFGLANCADTTSSIVGWASRLTEILNNKLVFSATNEHQWQCAHDEKTDIRVHFWNIKRFTHWNLLQNNAKLLVVVKEQHTHTHIHTHTHT